MISAKCRSEYGKCFSSEGVHEKGRVVEVCALHGEELHCPDITWVHRHNMNWQEEEAQLT